MSATTAQQLLVGGLASAVLVMALSRGRQGRLTLGLSLAWSGVAMVGIVTALLIPVLEDIGRLFGVVPAALLAGTVAVILSAVALDLSGAVTRQQDQIQDIVEALGIRSIEPPLPDAVKPSSPLVIMPALNEERTVGSCVRALRSLGLTVLVVDDGSQDRTGEYARSAGASVLRLETNLGVGGALRAAIRAARARGYSAVIQSDADGQHTAKAVAALIASAERSTADLLLGSRFLDEEVRRRTPFPRRVAHSVLAHLASASAATRLTDTTSGLRIIREPLLGALSEWLPRHYLGDTYEAVLESSRRGYRIEEVLVDAASRRFGSSSASTAVATRLTLRCLIVTIFPARQRLRRKTDGSASS